MKNWVNKIKKYIYIVIEGSRKKWPGSLSPLRHLLSSLSQLVTLPFQSQVCLSKSKASPLGHVICFRPDLVHLRGQKRRGLSFIIEHQWCLLSSWSQFLTLVFQSHVCLSMSNARPVGQRTVANLVTPISVALSHLRFVIFNNIFLSP